MRIANSRSIQLLVLAILGWASGFFMPYFLLPPSMLPNITTDEKIGLCLYMGMVSCLLALFMWCLVTFCTCPRRGCKGGWNFKNE